MKRFQLRLGAVLAALLFPVLAGCASLPEDTGVATAPLRIAIIGDRTGGHRPHVFEEALVKLDQMQPDLVLSVGDLVEGYTEDEAELARQWDEIEGQIARFGERFHSVPGNHDAFSSMSARVWRERRGAPYWSMVHDDVLILGLSTEDPPIALPPSAIEGHARLLAALERDAQATQSRILQMAGQAGEVDKPGDVAISEAQVDFVRAALAQTPSPRWTIVLMHKPAWQFDNPEFARIEALLADRPFTMIAGHNHYYEHALRNGRDYVTMGTTGGIWLREGSGRIDHLLWLTIGEGEPSYMNLAIEGMFGLSER